MLSAPLSANYDGLGERLVPLSSRLETEHERDATLLGHLLDTVTESIVRFEPSPSLALRFNPFDSSLTPSTPVRYETWIDPPVRAVLAARRPIVVTVSVYAALYLLSPRLLHRKCVATPATTPQPPRNRPATASSPSPPLRPSPPRHRLVTAAQQVPRRARAPRCAARPGHRAALPVPLGAARDRGGAAERQCALKGGAARARADRLRREHPHALRTALWDV